VPGADGLAVAQDKAAWLGIAAIITGVKDYRHAQFLLPGSNALGLVVLDPESVISRIHFDNRQSFHRFIIPENLDFGKIEPPVQGAPLGEAMGPFPCKKRRSQPCPADQKKGQNPGTHRLSLQPGEI
jgi:hypothetical protein